ncbi:filamin-A-like [Amphiura filiformis]|uniref:filamin-A-like n=1 Tax=Amphiura filiformis TaxID=82378 RepID=UPI003B21C39F
MTTGNAKVEATQNGDSLHAQDNNDGTYTIDYASSMSSGSPLHVMINGTEIKGSPFNTLQDVDPQQCTIRLGLLGRRGYQKAIVQTVDANGHDMTIGNAKIEATQNENSLGIKDNNDGTYTIEYDPYGNSQPLHVTINGTEIKGSPFNTLAKVDPWQCTIRLGSKHGSKKAIVQTVDANGHNMTFGNVKVEASQGGNLLHVQDNNDGTYTIDYASYECKQPVQVKINGTKMKGSPFNILPQVVDPQQCTIQLRLPNGNRNLKAIVQTIDVNGQKMTIGNAKVEAAQFGDTLHVQDNNDGTYTIAYASYGGSLHVKINGTEIKGSPFNTLQEVDPQRCTIRLGLLGRRGFQKAIVQTVDAKGLIMTTGNTKVEATQNGDSLDVQDNNDGTYTIEYDPYGDSLPLHVTINETEMKGSPFNTQPEVDPRQCTIRLGSRHGLNKALVQTVDVNGHNMTTGNAKVKATQGGDSVHVQDNNDGTYTIGYALSDGPLLVKINGTVMKGSPFSILPPVDPKQCKIQLRLPNGNGSKKAIVQTVDVNGQNMTTGIAKVEATQGGNSLDVQNNNDGTYTIAYASYGGSIHVKINGTEMTGSPFNVLPEVDPQQCTIQLGLPSTPGRKKAIVQTVDANGHKMTIGNAKVEATQGRYSLNVQDNNDGTYTIDYDPGMEAHY